jgi:hypothetical protein
MKQKKKNPKPNKKKALEKTANKILDRDEYIRKFNDAFKDQDNNLKDLF